jgi:putative transposase
MPRRLLGSLDRVLAKNAAYLQRRLQKPTMARAALRKPSHPQELGTNDTHVGRKRVARLMREGGISARSKRRFVNATNSNHDFPIAPNLLQRDFTADAPNEI